jgi:beta-mannosidase
VLKGDYVKLNVDTIRAVVLIEDPSRTFLISSPSNGIKTEQEGFVSTRPDSLIYGDSM